MDQAMRELEPAEMTHEQARDEVDRLRARMKVEREQAKDTSDLAGRLERKWERAAWDAEEARRHLGEMTETVIWMSGSADFSPGGQAGQGWATAQPKLKAALEFLRTPQATDQEKK